MTEWTWGATGTYPTLVAALTALPTPLTDDYRLLQVGDSVENAQFNRINYTHDGHYVEITSDTPHKGDPTVGHVCNCTGGGFLFFHRTNVADNYTWILHDLHIKTTAGGGGTIQVHNDGWPPLTHDMNFTMYNCLLDGGNVGPTGFAIYAPAVGHVGTGYIRVYNNKIYGWQTNQILICDLECDEILIENNIFDAQGFLNTYGIDKGGSSVATLRNNIFVRASTLDMRIVASAFPALPGATIRESNATEDATGDAGFQNKVPADEFASLVDTDSDYLFFKEDESSVDLVASVSPQRGKAPLKADFEAELAFTQNVGVTLHKGGVPPTYATTDIAGNPRPGSDGWWSLGCHEYMYKDWPEE